jgi:mannosyltransferase OCH1-like enzyme/UDP:flavonoid glycosyltransferase YjiC (YdhE family)
MKTIVIYADGTLGDHLPSIALGQALSVRGYRVRMAINRAMHPYAQRAGLEVIALDVERDPAILGSADFASLNPDTFETQVRELIELCRDADLLVATSSCALSFVVHHAIGIPWITFAFNPSAFVQPTSAEEQLALQGYRRQEYNQLQKLFVHMFRQLNISQPIPDWADGLLFARHILLACSPHFSLPNVEQFQPRASLDLTGFWYYQDPVWKDWQPDADLSHFCEHQPIALSLDRQPLQDNRQMLAKYVYAARRLNRPLLVQRGSDDFSEEDLPADANREAIRFVDSIPHDWLFAHAACAIQQGEISSMARALRQGCPLLIEPYGNDQFFNANRVSELRVGAAVSPLHSTVDELTQVLGDYVLSADCRARTQALGIELAKEAGITTACEMIERYLNRFDAQRQLPAIYERYTPPLVPRKRHASAESNVADKPSEQDSPQVASDMVPKPPPRAVIISAWSEIATTASEDARSLNVLPTRSATISNILHQTWKDAHVPSQFTAYQRSWQEHHPGWRYYLWTDADNREFLHRHYPWFLPIYDNYPAPIMRADAVRYFILHHFGGIYADLDAECVRPLDPLLADKEIVFGLEPEQHLRKHQERGYPLDRLVTNAFMASVPGHPFWEHVFRFLIGFHRAPNPLDATGPFLVTRAVESYDSPASIVIYPASMLSPLTSERPWHELSLEEHDQLVKSAYVLHHWVGTWWRPLTARQTEQAELSLFVKNSLVSQGSLRLDLCVALLHQEIALPRISCVMVIANRTQWAKRAINCFRRQTYTNKELIIIDPGKGDTFEQWVHELHDPQIIMMRLPSEGRTFGELGNLAVERASGTYVAQWNDDELSDPRRLEVQMATLLASQADVCSLHREILWWPERKRLAVSDKQLWEGTCLYNKTRLPRYPETDYREDMSVIEQLLARGRVALLDTPRLNVHVFHDTRTWAGEYWEELWQAATERYEDEHYALALLRLQEHLEIDFQVSNFQDEEETQENEEGKSVSVFPGLMLSTSENHPSSLEAEGNRATLDYPRVLILIPVKDAARFLPSLWQKLGALSYPHDRLSLALLESDSLDDTYAAIDQALPALRDRFSHVRLFKRDYGYHLTRPRWEASEQRQRRAILAKSRNYLLARALTDEDWVLWIDADVEHWPNDVIEQLLATGKDIVVPNCLQVSTGRTFDYNTFKFKPEAGNLDWSLYILNGIFLPPHGFGRDYLSDLREHDLIQVDAVGGTMLLVRADLHREGLIFPTTPYKYHIETEGLAMLAKDMGYQAWGLPNLEIWHP